MLVVIDGLTPGMLEWGVESGQTPALAFLHGRGTYRVGVSTFPSLTPVCLSSIATGGHPDVHGIPHLVWYHRGEERLVEYGSSLGAVIAAGTRRSLRDTIYGMNHVHLSTRAVTVFEALEDAGLVSAAVNFTCYRGRVRHVPTVPGLVPAALGPRRFFYYSLFESDATGAPFAVRRRSAGSVDDYAIAAGRWLVTRDGFDFLVYYLSDYDFASHAHGPDATETALRRADGAVAALLDSAGSWDEFLERYDVLVCSDHGQTAVRESVRVEDAFDDLTIFRRSSRAAADVAVTASNRAAMVYRLPGCPEDVRALAERLDAEPGAEAVFFLEDGEAVARRDGEELRFAPREGGWRSGGDEALLAYPNGMERVWTALANPNAGEVLVSAAPGVEFSDLGGGDHVGGGSHGSLVPGDSEVPMLGVGVEPVGSITDVAPLVLSHLGVEPPPYARSLSNVA